MIKLGCQWRVTKGGNDGRAFYFKHKGVKIFVFVGKRKKCCTCILAYLRAVTTCVSYLLFLEKLKPGSDYRSLGLIYPRLSPTNNLRRNLVSFNVWPRLSDNVRGLQNQC